MRNQVETLAGLRAVPREVQENRILGLRAGAPRDRLKDRTFRRSIVLEHGDLDAREAADGALLLCDFVRERACVRRRIAQIEALVRVAIDADGDDVRGPAAREARVAGNERRRGRFRRATGLASRTRHERWTRDLGGSGR